MKKSIHSSQTTEKEEKNLFCVKMNKAWVKNNVKYF